MKVEGITWHAITLDPEPFAATKKLMTDAFGLTPAMEAEGFALFVMSNGTMLELYLPEATPSYGYNGSLAFGFRVDDIEAASSELEAAGAEILGDIQRAEMGDQPYAYRHFRAPDGRVYGLNQLG